MAEKKSVQIEVDDIIVLLLGAPAIAPALQGKIEGITRLEKLIFLLEQESDFGKLLTEKSEFESHNFGPFSAKIYQAVDILVVAGLVEDSAQIASSVEDSWETEQVVGAEQADPYATRNFLLTDKGRKYYEVLIEELPKSAEKTLKEFKARFGALPLRQLIRYVYKKYPEFTDKSVIRDDILR